MTVLKKPFLISFFLHDTMYAAMGNHHLSTKAVTSVRSPKMKRDASVKVVFFLSKKTTFTEASLFIFGQRTDVTALVHN